MTWHDPVNFFHQKLRKGCPIGYVKFQHDPTHQTCHGKQWLRPKWSELRNSIVLGFIVGRHAIFRQQFWPPVKLADMYSFKQYAEVDMLSSGLYTSRSNIEYAELTSLPSGSGRSTRYGESQYGSSTNAYKIRSSTHPIGRMIPLYIYDIGVFRRIWYVHCRLHMTFICVMPKESIHETE